MASWPRGWHNGTPRPCIIDQPNGTRAGARRRRPLKAGRREKGEGRRVAGKRWRSFRAKRRRRGGEESRSPSRGAHLPGMRGDWVSFRLHLTRLSAETERCNSSRPSDPDFSPPPPRSPRLMPFHTPTSPATRSALDITVRPGRISFRRHVENSQSAPTSLRNRRTNGRRHTLEETAHAFHADDARAPGHRRLSDL